MLNVTGFIDRELLADWLIVWFICIINKIFLMNVIHKSMHTVHTSIGEVIYVMITLFCVHYMNCYKYDEQQNFKNMGTVIIHI